MITIDELYQEIADVLVEIVPERWSKILVNARVEQMDSKVFLYYYPTKKDEAICGDEIPVKFKAYKSLYPQLLEELEVTFSQLWYAVKEQENETFTNVTYIIKGDGEIDVKYSEQDDVEDDVFISQWKEKFL